MLLSSDRRQVEVLLLCYSNDTTGHHAGSPHALTFPWTCFFYFFFAIFYLIFSPFSDLFFTLVCAYFLHTFCLFPFLAHLLSLQITTFQTDQAKMAFSEANFLKKKVFGLPAPGVHPMLS